MEVTLRLATLADVNEVLNLHYLYQIDSIAEEDKQDGFITTAFTQSHLVALIEEEQGLFVAIVENQIVAYAMSASWAFWCQWPMFQFMVEHLSDTTLDGNEITVNNSYQYGPVCVDKRVRGSGVFEQLFQYTRVKMSARYSYLITFINQINTRSYQAHTRKVGLQVMKEFEFNQQRYFKLGCLTTPAN
ncbi:MAG: hypothetical protein P1U57_05245 [Oleibacter sp.]|nr:hypothetical protein [Thalassolituus sp.]